MAKKNNRRPKNIGRLILKIAQRYKTRVFLVGGPVRDFLLGRGQRRYLNNQQLFKFINNFKSKIDLDFAVENNYQAIGNHLAKLLNAKVYHYPQFMTMTLQLKDSRHIDIAQTRKEIYPKPAVLPKVSKATIAEDLKRRDFTINAIAIAITKENQRLNIIDPFGGVLDLQKKLVRILHPNSFIDDPTRIFRAIRFATRFNFNIEPETEKLMKQAIDNNLLLALTPERVLYELKMIMKEIKSKEILTSLQSYKIFANLYQTIIPKKFFIEHSKLSDDTHKLIHFFSYLPEKYIIKYPLLKEHLQAIRQLKDFIKYRQKLLLAKKPSEIYNLLKVFNQLTLEILMNIESKAIKNKLNAFINRYSKIKPSISGKTLKKLNVPVGPVYSKIINRIHQLKLDGKIQTRADEIKYVKALIKTLNYV
ncbi:MAG: hypothetical protein ABIK19_04945 [candidate division WOR-3 bacterium]